MVFIQRKAVIRSAKLRKIATFLFLTMVLTSKFRREDMLRLLSYFIKFKNMIKVVRVTGFLLKTVYYSPLFEAIQEKKK